MNEINNVFKTHINNLDKDIINLFSMQYKTSSIYKHPNLAKIKYINDYETNMSLLDYIFINLN